MGEVEDGKACAILMYFFPIGLIWWLADDKMKKNNFAKFHLKQSIVLLIAWAIIYVAGSIIPFIGWFIILPIGGILVFILWILGIINSASGNEKELPVIGQFAKKLTF